MEYGYFTEEGRAYRITTPFTPSPFTNKLFNDEYQIDISQRMEGGGLCMAENYAQTPLKSGDNHFYVNFNGEPHILCRGNGVSYSCVHRLYETELTEDFKNFSVTLRIFIPTKGQREIWTFTVKNRSEAVATVSTFVAFPLTPAGMQCEARLDESGRFIYQTGYPGYWKYEDYAQQLEMKKYIYIVSDKKPQSYECDRLRFFGSDYTEGVPVAVKNGCCENGSYEQDRTHPMSVIHHAFTLGAGESQSINFMIGHEKTLAAVSAVADAFPSIDRERAALQALWEKRCGTLVVETPEKELNYLTNYWLKRQLTFFARLNRGGTYCPVRNQLQDYLGYAMIDPEEALKKTIKILERQHHNGYLKQYYHTDGKPDSGLCLMRHSDSYIWLILCTIEVIEKTGNKENYMLPVGYMDSPLREPILTHLLKAARYMSTQIGEHGLCLMLDGDWNDPVNGPGHKGKGESGWNSMAFAYALERLLEISPDESLDAFRLSLVNAINTHLWDGEWYAAGINDDGIPYGVHTDKDAQKFLNTQTWAIIAGVATGERLKKVVATIETMRVPFGYLIIDPLFTEYSPIWGRVSLKQAGTTENGSVYCHSVMFKILADCLRGDGESAYETMMCMLPTNPGHTPDKSRQIPIYYSNYYFGHKDENFGLSSYHYRTGTVAWHYWTLIEYMIGFRVSASNGVSYAPCLPAAWKSLTVARVFAGKTYTLTVKGGEASITEV